MIRSKKLFSYLALHWTQRPGSILNFLIVSNQIRYNMSNLVLSSSTLLNKAYCI